VQSIKVPSQSPNRILREREKGRERERERERERARKTNRKTERRESESSRERRLERERERERDDGRWCLGRDPNKYCIHTLIHIRIPSSFSSSFSHGERLEECLEVINSWAVADRSGISAVRELVVRVSHILWLKKMKTKKIRRLMKQ
jgi:hypothetical protein